MNVLLSKKKRTLISFLSVVKSICIVKVESRECEILKTAFKKEAASRDVMSWGEELTSQ